MDCTWCFDRAYFDASSQLVDYEGGQGFGLHILHSEQSHVTSHEMAWYSQLGDVQDSAV